MIRARHGRLTSDGCLKNGVGVMVASGVGCGLRVGLPAAVVVLVGYLQARSHPLSVIRELQGYVFMI